MPSRRLLNGFGLGLAGVVPAATEAEAAATANIGSEAEINKAVAAVDEQSDFQEESIGDEISHATSEAIPLEVNAAVEKWLSYFLGRDRERFQQFTERGER